MGRSQIKYRSSRGRGDGSSTRGGREGAASAGSSRGSQSKRRGGGRALGSNAFRYEEREEQDEGDDHNENETIASTTRRQFFAGEQNYRDLGDAKESYFRTKAMQRWEAEEDDKDDIEIQLATSTVGVMDFAWIAEQLRAVPPSLRFQIDPKYCNDFASEHPVLEESREPEEPETTLTRSVPQSTQSNPSQTLEVPPRQHQEPPAASTLDDLLALSTSAAMQSASTPNLASPVAISPVPVAATQVPADGNAQKNLEDWLDDVLDL